MNKLLRPKEAAMLLGITVRSLQNLDKEGKIKCIRTEGGRRRFPESEVKRLRGEIKEDKVWVIYARVSSYEQKQKGDLGRQVEYLRRMVPREIREIQEICDVGSGLNDQRKGLIRLMELVSQDKITDVAITDKDRLTRFGFNYLEKFFHSFNVQIHVYNEQQIRSLEYELVTDMLSIVTSFSGKLYGIRSAKRKKLLENVRKVIEEKEENTRSDSDLSDSA